MHIKIEAKIFSLELWQTLQNTTTLKSFKECHPRCVGKLVRWKDSQKHNSYDI